MLCYAKVIEDISTTKKHKYIVVEKDILEYIGKNDSNALHFLLLYIEKVLEDSELLNIFNEFFKKQNNQSFNYLKSSFVEFYHKYTPVKKDYEPKRIFTKVLNPLAFKNKKKGTEKGRISKDIIKKADMMYNRNNFRDIFKEKPKGVTRQEWLKEHPDLTWGSGYFDQLMNKAKRTLRKHNKIYYNNISEMTRYVKQEKDYMPATQIHHIFPSNVYPNIKYYIENLIALTPNQHFSQAHPNNCTQMVDLMVQEELIIAKVSCIKENLCSLEEEHIYDFKNLLLILSVAFSDDSILALENNNYTEIIRIIKCHYSSL